MNPNVPTRVSRVLAALLALIVAGAGAVVGFGGLVFANLRCDDTCDPGATDWHRNPDAWQWVAQAVLAGGAFVASIVLAFLLFTGHKHGRVPALVAGLGLSAAWFALLAGG